MRKIRMGAILSGRGAAVLRKMVIRQPVLGAPDAPGQLGRREPGEGGDLVMEVRLVGVAAAGSERTERLVLQQAPGGSQTASACFAAACSM